MLCSQSKQLFKRRLAFGRPTVASFCRVARPYSSCMPADGSVMRLLKVASTAAKGGDNCCRSIGFEHRLGQPTAWTHVHKIDSRRVRVGIVEIRPVNTTQPVQALGIAGPDVRAVVDRGEPGDPTVQALLIIHDTLTEAAQPQLTGALDRRPQIDIIAARPHWRAVHLLSLIHI